MRSARPASEIDALRVRLAELETERAALDAKCAELKAENAELRAQLFGKKSERLSPEDEGQSRLFNEIESEAAKGPELFDAEPVAVDGHARRRPGRKPLPADLPRVRIEHDIPERAKRCACGADLARIGAETHEKLDIVPPVVRVLHHVRYKYACRKCEGAGDEGRPPVIVAPGEPDLLPGSIAGPGLLAFALTAKFQDGLPFYRLSAALVRSGVELSRATLCNHAIALSRTRPVRRLLATLRSLLFEYAVIASDETPLKVIRSERANSFMWVLRGGPPEKPVLWFQYRPTRSPGWLGKILRGWKGTLVSDGYEAYDALVRALPGVEHAGCWAHGRRPFFKFHKLVPDSEAARHALGVVRALYAVEDRARRERLGPGEIRALRREHAAPLLKQFKEWLDEQALRVPPKSGLGKAVGYALGQWPKLLRYLDDGRIPIDNNLVENAIRPFVVGRKGWLFSMVPAGAHASAAFYTLVENAKANGLEPYRYLLHLFTLLPLARTRADFVALLPQFVDPVKVDEFAKAVR